MSSSVPAVSVVAPELVVLRPPLRAHAAGGLVGSGLALLPYTLPELVTPWEASRLALGATAALALAVHAGLRAVTMPAEGSWRRFALAALFPGVAIAVVAALVHAACPHLRACAYAAFVAAAAASTLDVWEATALVRARPARVRAAGRSVTWETNG